MASLDSDDDDFGYDLSVEDEKLLASLADAAHPTDSVHSVNRLFQKPGTGLHDAADPSSSSPRRMAALVGIARTNSVNTFMRKTQPESTPSVMPTDDIQYPDRMCPFYSTWMRFCQTILTDFKGSSHQSVDQFGARPGKYSAARKSCRITNCRQYASSFTSLPNFSKETALRLRSDGWSMVRVAV